MKNKHLTLSDRNDIQIGIEQLKPFSAIATKLGKDPSTISKEVRRNMVIKENSSTANCEACPLLKKAPYVCNACPKKRSNCGYQKQFYYAKRAGSIISVVGKSTDRKSTRLNSSHSDRSRMPSSA